MTETAPQDAAMLYSPLSGMVFDYDDLEGIKTALNEIEGYLDGYYQAARRQHKQLFDARDALRERVAELEPVTIPRRPSQRSSAQEKVLRCPRCNTVFEEPEPEPQAAERTSTAAVSETRARGPQSPSGSAESAALAQTQPASPSEPA